MAKASTKLTVKTDIGTFSRRTVRTYSHIVVVKGYRKELLEAARLNEIRSQEDESDRYEASIATGQEQLRGRERSYGDSHQRWLADGSYAKWAKQSRAKAAELKAAGPVTEDGNGWTSFYPQHRQPAEWFVLGWTGRLDLAGKLAATKQAEAYREVRIYAIDGTRVA